VLREIIGAFRAEGAPLPISVAYGDSSALHGLRTSPRGEPSWGAAHTFIIMTFESWKSFRFLEKIFFIFTFFVFVLEVYRRMCCFVENVSMVW
jgi:hypothetical protein